MYLFCIIIVTIFLYNFSQTLNLFGSLKKLFDYLL